jgi:hypothetical protein
LIRIDFNLVIIQITSRDVTIDENIKLSLGYPNHGCSGHLRLGVVDTLLIPFRSNSVLKAVSGLSALWMDLLQLREPVSYALVDKKLHTAGNTNNLKDIFSG